MSLQTLTASQFNWEPIDLSEVAFPALRSLQDAIDDTNQYDWPGIRPIDFTNDIELDLEVSQNLLDVEFPEVGSTKFLGTFIPTSGSGLGSFVLNPLQDVEDDDAVMDPPLSPAPELQQTQSILDGPQELWWEGNGIPTSGMTGGGTGGTDAFDFSNLDGAFEPINLDLQTADNIQFQQIQAFNLMKVENLDILNLGEPLSLNLIQDNVASVDLIGYRSPEIDGDGMFG